MVFFFHKYQATGNDFILIDNRNGTFPKKSVEIISNLCNRHYGIGSDGLILLETACSDYDFKMVYFNSDGKEAEICGNGARCITAFAKKCGIIKNSFVFVANDGVHYSVISEESGKCCDVKLKMNDVEKIEMVENGYYLNTGVPHYVLFVSDLNKIDVEKEGRKIRYAEFFSPNGTNVNFCEIKNNEIYNRTYERGVELETLSCGTGAIAAAVSAVYSGRLKQITSGSIIVNTKGGQLIVFFDKCKDTFSNIWLQGPACFVFDGKIEI